MTTEGYCRLYKIPKEVIPVMQHINSCYWYLFASKKVINTSERNIILCTGYYTGTGPNCKRVSLTPMVTKACLKVGFRFSAYNDAPKGGVKGDKVKIYFPIKVEEKELKIEQTQVVN